MRYLEIQPKVYSIVDRTYVVEIMMKVSIDE